MKLILTTLVLLGSTPALAQFDPLTGGQQNYLGHQEPVHYGYDNEAASQRQFNPTYSQPHNVRLYDDSGLQVERPEPPRHYRRRY